MFLQRKYLQATYMLPRISRIYKEFSKLSKKIGKKPIRRWPKGMEMLLKMAKNTWKDVQYYLSLFSRLTVSDSVQLHGLQHARPLCPSFPKVCPSSCPLHQWCHPAISSSEALFSFCPHFFPSIRDFFQRVGCSHQVTKILELQLQHQSFQWVFRVDFPSDWLVWFPCCLRDS